MYRKARRGICLVHSGQRGNETLCAFAPLCANRPWSQLKIADEANARKGARGRKVLILNRDITLRHRRHLFFREIRNSEAERPKNAGNDNGLNAEMPRSSVGAFTAEFSQVFDASPFLLFGP